MNQDAEAKLFDIIKTPLRLTWAGLWAERLTRAFWPLWTVAIAAVAALALGLQDYAPLEFSWFAMVITALGLIWAGVYGLRQFRLPTRTEALVRLDSRMAGQPIAALHDAQAIGATDPASRAVWEAHRARMAARLGSARAVEPDLKLAARDPFALRYVALTALVMAVLFGSLWRVTTLSGIAPSPANAAAGPAWEGWAKPPSYTGKPALYLNDQLAEVLTLPEGTKLQVRLYGNPGALILSETVSGRTDAPAASDPVQDFTVAQSGALEISGAGGRKWQVIATPDASPTITPEATIGREADGRFKQKFTATDDYGVTKGQATITLDLAAVDRRFGLTVEPEAIAPVVLDLPLPVKGSRAEIKSTLIDDLSKSVLANLPVTISYAASDAAGQTGTAAAIKVVLPGKRFFDPLADAIIEMRRDLLWSRENAPESTMILKAIANRAEEDTPDAEALKRLRAAIKRLDSTADLTPAIRDELAEELWQVSLMIEDGQLNSAKDRLKRAQDRVSEAIRKGASPEEMQALMDEMRKALDDYMAEEAKKNPPDPNDETSPQQSGPTITQDQIQQMMDKIQQLMEEGKTAEAAEAMRQLQELLNNMKVQQGDGQGQGQGPAGRAMKDLGNTLRDQQGLSDDSFRDLQDGQENTQPGEKSLSERQQELRKRLDGMKNGADLPGKGNDKGEQGREKLGDAGRSMEEAERALREGDLPSALDKQAEAMDKMRQGLRDFGDALAEEQRKEGGSPDGEKTAEADTGTRDPLGRENSARIGSDKNLLQGEDVYRRAQELLDEIRKRSGEQARPETERNYLKRLLDLF
jgi:uncharacterized protein (TIGR02302 family)